MLNQIEQIVIEGDIDICAFSEAASLDENELTSLLGKKGEEWHIVEILRENDLKVFARKSIDIHPQKEEKHYSIFKISDTDESILFIVLHLPSAMYLEESARDAYAYTTSEELRKVEESFFGQTDFKTIIVGDFNLQPFSNGISSGWGFNATMSPCVARKISRVVNGYKKLFYFNPMWHLMGKNHSAQGTYYSDTDSQNKSMYWYTFDEVLLRPYFIDRFDWDSFAIVERTKDFNLINGCKINKTSFSDHLPIKFEIKKRGAI